MTPEQWNQWKWYVGAGVGGVLLAALVWPRKAHAATMENIPMPKLPPAPTGPIAVAPSTNGITVDQLKQAMPTISAQALAAYINPLNKAMDEFGINPKQRAMFISQLAHESGDLRYFEELASGDAYEGRADLGNTQPGDGRRFKGRGPIQLTGRANYRAAGRALGLPLEARPDLATSPDVGFRTAGWYWKTHNIGPLAEAGDIEAVTRKINGGLNGIDDRKRRYAIAKAILG